MLLSVHPENPEGRKINQIVDVLKKGGVVIYPNDTVYALGCDIQNEKAIEKICRLRNIDPKKASLSFVCENIGQIGAFTTQMDKSLFKLLKRNTPGPFTFILNANNSVPKLFKNKKRTIGARIPANNITQAIIEALGRPILSMSLKSDDEILEYFTDPIDIEEDFGKQVDLVIDGGIGASVPSTIIDCTSDEIFIVREGKGTLN